MKKIYFALFIFFLLSQSGIAQNFQWAKTFGGPTYDDWRAISVDAAGDVVSVGSFSGTVDFDPGAGVFNLTSTSGGDDLFILKLTAAGTFVWAKRIGAAADEFSTDVITDASNNIYVTGGYQGTVDFDPNAGVVNLTSAGNNDVFMLKLSAAGNYVWAKSMGGVFSDYGSAIELDASNNVYITGTFRGTADFNPSATTNTLNVFGIEDAFVGKYDINGNYLWAVSMGGAAGDYGYDLKVNSANNIVYCTGVFYGSNVNLTPGCACTTYTSQGQGDIYIVKLVASSGGYNSLAVIGGSSYDTGQNLQLDASDNVYLSGQFSAACDMDPGPLVQNLGSLGSSDAFVLKLTPNLAYTWSKQIGGLNTQSAPGMILDPLGNIYLTGMYDDIVDFDPNIGTYTLQANGSNQDCYVSKWDNNSNFIWARSFGSNNLSDYGSDIDLDAQGNIYSIGTFWSSVDFDPGPASFSLTSNGQTDGYIQKLSCTLPSTVSVSSANNTLCVGASANSALTISNPSVGTTYAWSVVGASGVIFSPTSGTVTSITYTGTTSFSIVVAGTNACGTTTNFIGNVLVNPLPTLTTVASPASVCSGSLVTLTASGANTYTWTNGVNNGVAFTLSNSQNYTVTATNVNGCVNTKTITVPVINNPTLSVLGKNLVCLNKPNTLTASGASSYTWQPGSVVSNTFNAQALTNTTYTVSGTASNGCKNFTTYLVNLVTPLTPSICMVTVDSLSINNEIYWDETNYPNVDSFIVHREVSTNVYKRIGAVSKSALSMFTDTARSIGPANGNPNLTSYKYRLQLRDTCGNLSAQGPYHQTIFIQDQQNGNFNWNSYAIEFGTPPISNYVLTRRDVFTGVTTTVGATTSNLLSDPQYTVLAQNGNVKWLIDAVGFNCTPTLKTNGTLVLKSRTKSNQTNERQFPQTINSLDLKNLNITIYPNPTKNKILINLVSPYELEYKIELLNILGQSVYIKQDSIPSTQTNEIDLSNYQSGIYFVNFIYNGKTISTKKIVKM